MGARPPRSISISKRRRRRARPSRRLILEPLEDRSLLAVTITVNSVLDNDARDAGLTLREAIEINNGWLAVGSLSAQEQAQVTGTLVAGDKNTINFNISGTGVHTINSSSGLPGVSAPVIIDGYTQPGSVQNSDANGFNGSLQIELKSAAITLYADNCVVRGLVVDGVSGAAAVFINSSNNVIQGNFLGTDPTGKTAASDRWGVDIYGGGGNIIGGSSAAARNL